MREYVVQITQSYGQDDNGQDCLLHQGGKLPESFLNNLRFAGLISVHAPIFPVYLSFDILPPLSLDTSSLEWAESLANRMRSFGYLAEVKPLEE